LRNPVIVAAVITGLATVIAALIAWHPDALFGGGTGNQKPDYSKRVGHYTGEAVNKSQHIRRPASLDLVSIDKNSGNVAASVDLATDHPVNTGNLAGTIAKDATINLSGAVTTREYTWDATFDCRFTDPETIECNFALDPRAGNPSGTIKGTLSATKR
jgi:hypothetical protein